MIKYKLEFFVGLFILFGIIAFLILVLKVSDITNFHKKEKFYSIKGIFKHVGNLKKKAKVTVCGVRIGFVNSINLKKSINNEYYSEVELFINSNINEIPIDSSINILMSNILGDNYVQIELGNENLYLKNGDVVTFTTQAVIIEELLSKIAIK